MVLVTHYQRLLDYIVPGPRARAVRRAHREVGRPLARARARAARLRLGAGEPGRMSAQPRSRRARPPRCGPSRRSGVARAGRSAVGAARAAPWSAFLQLGLPTTRDESWRYTNLRRLGRAELRRCAARAGRRPRAARARCASLGAAGDARAATRAHGERPSDVCRTSARRHIKALKSVAYENYLEQNPTLLARHLRAAVRRRGARWELLNTALVHRRRCTSEDQRRASPRRS